MNIQIEKKTLRIVWGQFLCYFHKIREDFICVFPLFLF